MAGNHNSGRRPKPFDEALKMELLAAGSDFKALRLVALQLIEKAQAGDLNAIKELADRVDGKVPQAIIGGEKDDPAIAITGEVTLSATGAIVERVARGGTGSASS